jgi:hypothetical protein
VVAALVLAGLLPGSPAQPPTGPPDRPGAATDLPTLALVAARQPASGPPGPGQFQYTKSESLNITDSLDRPYYYSVDYVQHRQIWIGFDASGRIVETNTHPTFPSHRDRANWLAAGHPSLRVPPLDDKFGPHGLSGGPVNLLKLPTDPAKLAALISSRKIDGGPPGPAEDFARVGDLLRETDAPPALRSALFQVAAHIPGVTVLGTVTDPVGSGVGVAYISRHRAGAAGKSSGAS